jgi:hypothetical protein
MLRRNSLTDRQRQIASDIEALCQFDRTSASPGERDAAGWVRSRLEGIGLETQIEEFHFFPDYWTVWGAHALGAYVAARLARNGKRRALVAAGLSSFLAASFWGDLTSAYYWLRDRFPARLSYNVLARLPNPNASHVVIVCAHHDAAHSGTVFNPRIQEWAVKQLGSPAGRGPSIMRLPFAGLLLTAAGATGRALGLPRWLTALPLRLGGTINLLTAAAMLDIGRSPTVPGANDDASGVAAMLAMAEELHREPPENLEVWFLSTGCEEGILGGMLNFVKRHRGELDRDRHLFLNFEVLGAGKIVYMEGEGFLKLFPYDAGAVALAAQAAREADFQDVEPVTSPLANDSLVPTRRGLAAVTIASEAPAAAGLPHYHWPSDTPENVDPASVERGFLFARRMVGLAQERVAVGTPPW